MFEFKAAFNVINGQFRSTLLQIKGHLVWLHYTCILCVGAFALECVQVGRVYFRVCSRGFNHIHVAANFKGLGQI